jgi:hypothetical protein
MDFSDFDLRDGADDGMWLHLTDPYSGSLLYRDDSDEIVTEETDKPCRVLIRGNHSEQMRKMLRAWERKDATFGMRIMRVSEKDAEAVTKQRQDALEKHHDALLLCAVIDWENVTARKDPKDKKSKPLVVERSDDAVLRLMRNNGFQTQIIRAAADEAAFFSNALTG